MINKERVLVSRTIAVPADTNPWGDIFGGWIMSLMDIAAPSNDFPDELPFVPFPDGIELHSEQL